MRSSIALALLCLGCLPDDTRAPPGRLNVNLRAHDALVSGVTTADGWTLGFERALIALGEVELGGDDCTSYNETDYLRLFDLRLGEPQKVSTPYARGRCDIAFQLASPPETVVLGAGVTPEDVLAFRTAGSDAFEANAGLVLLVSGSATDGGTTKRFEWSFRRGTQYENCRLGDEAGVLLASHDDQTLEIQADVTALFRASPEDGSELRFAPFAAADADADGAISLDELGALPGPSGFASYAEYVYTGLAPLVPRYRDTGSCDVGPIEDDGF